MRSRLGRILRGIVIALAGVTAIALLPVVIVEGYCGGGQASSPGGQSVLARAGFAAAARPEAQSYLTYPEWYIVHAYEDLAGHLKDGDESDFGYLDSISGFWSSLCQINRLAGGSKEATTEIKVTLYTIGVSFSAEFALKGAYEVTIGRLFEWIRGPWKTAEDRFAHQVTETYAAFLHQTPWYAFPFTKAVGDLWALEPDAAGSYVRALERRLFLSAEWGAKAGYAHVIGLAAALGPAEREIVSVLQLPPQGSPDLRLTVLRDLGEGIVLVRTPRYRAFTEILVDLARQGGTPLEIAGNRRGLATVLAPAEARTSAALAGELFSVPVQSRPGLWRIGLDLKVAEMGAVIRALEAEGVVFEHFYDY